MGLEVISTDLPDEQLLAYWKLMQDESYMAFLDMVALGLPKPKDGGGGARYGKEA